MLRKSMLLAKKQVAYANFEIHVMTYMKHPNILGIERIDKRDFDILIHMKFLVGGDLQKLYKKLLANPNFYVPEDIILFWAH